MSGRPMCFALIIMFPTVFPAKSIKKIVPTKIEKTLEPGSFKQGHSAGGKPKNFQISSLILIE